MGYLQMTLFYMFTHQFTLWPKAYECPENAAEYGTKWPRFGIYCFTSGCVFLFLHALCFIAICKVKSFTPAYQLMFMIAIYDMTSLAIGSIILGYLSYYGIFFCHSPLFFYLIGGIAMTSWMNGCVVCILLALERCSEINPKFFLQFLFGKNAFKVVMAVVLTYSITVFLFVKPVIFNPDYASFIFDPVVGKDPTLFINLWAAYNNIVVAIATTSLNFYLCYYLIFKFGYSTSMWLYKSKRQIIMQAVILCFFHSAAAIIYDLMQLITPPLWLIIMGEVVWQLSCGCLPVAYLTLNRSIRNSVLKMMVPKIIRVFLGLYIGIEEHLAFEKVVDGTAAVVNAGGLVVKVDNFIQN